jgi:hypothetical protein
MTEIEVKNFLGKTCTEQMGMLKRKRNLNFLEGRMDWGLNSRLCTFKAGALLLELHLQFSLLCLFWRWGLANICPSSQSQPQTQATGTQLNFVLFETGFHYVAWAGLGLEILLTQCPQAGIISTYHHTCLRTLIFCDFSGIP